MPRARYKRDPRLGPWERVVMPTPRTPGHFALAPMALKDALDDLIQRLAEGEDPMELATRYALLVERGRVLRLEMDVVSSQLDVASQMMASRLADRMELPFADRPERHSS
jgi:hypothetical protein